MYLFTNAGAVHTLVLYGFVCIYVLAAVVTEGVKEELCSIKPMLYRVLANIAAFSAALLIIANIYIGNQAYLRIQLAYENMYSFYTGLVSEIKMSPDFKENTKIALIGKPEELVYNMEEFSSSGKIKGSEGIILNSYAREDFIKYFIGFDAEFAGDGEKEQIISDSEFKNMPVYPYYGSVKMIDGCIVVKFSDITE